MYFSFICVSIESFIFEYTNLNKWDSVFIIYFISAIIFYIPGYFINKLIYKHKCNKIITKIEKVFNKQNIIDRLREELDERYNEDNLNKSLDTIGIIYIYI